ncbi:hypothetical protein LSAT2_003199 [Lamellibrachia satsuma]|nr:hypothetical protein LSAT2_003199 [Lamellibrachia satsuma]
MQSEPPESILSEEAATRHRYVNKYICVYPSRFPQCVCSLRSVHSGTVCQSTTSLSDVPCPRLQVASVSQSMHLFLTPLPALVENRASHFHSFGTMKVSL